MTEKEFIEQYVARNSNMIGTGMEEHGLSREQMIHELTESARKSWALLQQEIAAVTEDKQDGLSLTDLRPGNIYTAYLPEENWTDEADEARKIIFTPVRAPKEQEEAIYVLFVLYKARNGSFVLDVCDHTAKCHCSRSSDLCVCRRYHTVGIEVNRIFDYTLRTANKEEVERVYEMLASADCTLAHDPKLGSAWIVDVPSGKTVSKTNPIKQ